MKVFKLNDTETVVAETLEQAKRELFGILGGENTANYSMEDFEEEYDIDPTEIPEKDHDKHFVFFNTECESDLYSEEGRNKYRISFKELIEKHPDECPIHFTTEF